MYRTYTILRRFILYIFAVCMIAVYSTGCRKQTQQNLSPFTLQQPPETQSNSATSVSAIPQEQDITFWSDYPPDILSAELTNRMSDEELLSQILMFGWAGAEPSREIMQWVEQRHIGSVKIFGWNTDDTVQLAASVALLQKAAQKTRFKIPLFVATDQEGGWIRHVKGKTSETPGNLAIGASGIPYDAYMSSWYIAQELRTLGINMNFAPTVDLYTDIHSTVIGPRSFGEDPDITGILAAAFCRGHMDSGVLPTAKHFPGHGDTNTDSHGVLPVINADYETLQAREFVPFIRLIDEKIPAIMAGHLNFPNITGNAEPASLSSFFLRDVLRTQLHFDGLIITDDMMMNGATTTTGSLSRAVIKAIQAGNDIILSSTTPFMNDPLWRRALDTMKTDRTFRSSVIHAARRVVYTKLLYLKGEHAVPLFPTEKEAQDNLPAGGAADFFLDQACRAITTVKSDGLPLSGSDSSRILIAGQFQPFIQAGKVRYPDARQLLIPYSLGPNGTAYYARQLEALSEHVDTVIFCIATKESRKIFDSLRGCGKKVIAVSVLAPVFLQDTGWADAVVAAYGYAPVSFTAAFAVIAGDFSAHGTMPLSTLSIFNQSEETDTN